MSAWKKTLYKGKVDSKKGPSKMPPGEETHKRHICYFSYPGSLLSQPLCHSYIIQGKSEGVIKYKQPITNESTGTISE
jgi:hypothetical protein